MTVIRLKKGMEIYPYVITEILPQGRGGMAQVCVASLKSGDEKVALKISRGSSQNQRFENALSAEALILLEFNHPNVIKILPSAIESKYDHPMARALNLPGQPWYFAMEYLRGSSLKSIIGSKSMTEHIASSIIRSIATGLNHVHSKEIAHLDLKPENIVFRNPLKRGENLEPVLIDFGIAANVKAIQTDSGSLAFMPPERINQVGKKVAPEYANLIVDPIKIDVYGLGVVFYELITGRLPFRGNTRRSLTSAILNHILVPPREIRKNISARIENLLMDMLDEDPQRRPSLVEVMESIDGFYRRVDRLELDIPVRRH